MTTKAPAALPDNRNDYIREHFEILTFREMGSALGISAHRVYEIARYQLRLGPKPPIIKTYDHVCKACGTKTILHNSVHAKRAFCYDCRPKPTGKGKRAYHLRHATQKPWREIAVEVSSKSSEAVQMLAKKYAIRHKLPWPVPKLTMADVIKLARSQTNQPPSPQAPPPAQ